MIASQFQKANKKLLPYIFMICLILLFATGIPLRGEDLAFSKTLGKGGLSSWLAHATDNGGNILSGFLNAMTVDVPILRHVVLSACLSLAMIALIGFSDLRRPYLYFVALLLALGAPARIFAYSFGGTLGGGIVFLPAFLLIMYLFSLSDLINYRGRKKSWKIPILFVSGFVSQLFSESIGIAFFALAFLCLIVFYKKVGFSLHLIAHLFGCVLGFILNQWIPGACDGLSASFYVLVDQLTLALDQLFISNVLVMSALTLSCLLLIQPFRSERSKNCNITLGCLLIPMCGFIMLSVMNSTLIAFVSIFRVVTILKLVLAIVYTVGIYRTLQHYVSKDKVITRVEVGFIALWVFMIVFGATGTMAAYFLYIPYLLLVAITMTLLAYALHRYSRQESVLRKPLFFVGLLGVLVLSFITISNLNYCEVVDTHITDNLSAGTTEIQLPRAPFESRLVPTDNTQLSDYYDFDTYGTVELTYVPFGTWDWKTYYDAHNIPVIEEEGKKAKKDDDDWIGEIQED